MSNTTCDYDLTMALPGELEVFSDDELMADDNQEFLTWLDNRTTEALAYQMKEVSFLVL